MCSNNNKSIFFILLLIFTISSINFTSAQYMGLKFIEKIFNQCQKETNIVKCLKVQVLKLANVVLKLEKINLYDGIDLVRDTRGRNLKFYRIPKNLNFQKLQEDQVDFMLNQAIEELLSTRYLEFRQPKSLGEARDKRKKISFWPLLAAMAIKTGFMGVAYKGIAVTAGAAMLIGKMALILCAIMGLKSLISGKEEKLNVEVVKHPMHSTSHTFSNSYEDDHYHRSISAEEEMLRRGEEKWDPKK